MITIKRYEIRFNLQKAFKMKNIHLKQSLFNLF